MSANPHGLAGAIGFDVIDLDGQRTVGERLCIRRNGDTVFGEFCGSGLSAQLHQIKHWRARGGPAVGDDPVLPVQSRGGQGTGKKRVRARNGGA